AASAFEIAAPMPRVPPVTTATLLMVSFPFWPLGPRAPCRAALLLRVLVAPAARGSALDRHRDAHAAADAQGGEALLGVAARHLVQQRHQDARAGRADRVADGDRAAVDV